MRIPRKLPPECPGECTVKAHPRWEMLMTRLPLARWLAAVLGLAVTMGTLTASEPAPAPHWISIEPKVKTQVRRDFDVDAAIQSMRLKVAADFCEIAIEINGRLAAVVEPYGETVELDVTPLARLGSNQI